MSKIYQCKICNKNFEKKHHLVQHRSVHSDERPFFCKICKNFYKTEKILKMHIINMHEDKKKFSCSKCDRNFYDEKRFENHSCGQSTKIKIPCSICGKIYAKSSIVRHENSHKIIIEAKYQCQICRKKFHYKTDFDKHMRKCEIKKAKENINLLNYPDFFKDFRKCLDI